MQAVWMLAAALFFALMSVCVKFAAPYFDPLEMVGWRGAIGVVMFGVLARSRGISLKTRVPRMHLWRNVIGVAAMAAVFYALTKLPIATALTLESMSSVWIAVFIVAGALLAGGGAGLRRQAPLVGAILLGFAGVVMVLGPTLGQNELAAGLVGLAGGFMAALAYMQLAALGRAGEPDTRTVFYYSIGCTLAGLAWVLVSGAHALDHPQALWLIPIGIFGGLSQLCMTRAYTHGATIVVANLQYASIVFGALLGLVLFGNRIAPIGWIGMAAIVASGMAATALRVRAATPPVRRAAHRPRPA